MTRLVSVYPTFLCDSSSAFGDELHIQNFVQSVLPLRVDVSSTTEVHAACPSRR